MALNTEEFLKQMKGVGDSFGVSLTATTQTFNDARQYSCAVNNDAKSYSCASHYDAFYGNDIKEANNELDQKMSEFEKKMEEWMERFEDSPLKTNERKVRQAMKTSLPPPPQEKSAAEQLAALVAESRRNLGDGLSSREPYSPSRQVGSIESELNSQLMGLKKDYRKLEEKYQRLKEENSSLRRANDTLGATIADYKKKLFVKQKKQDVVKPVKNVFDSIKKWFYE